MKDIIAEIDHWYAEGDTAVALATVVSTWGSAPRRVGAKMAVSADGRIVGSISGGCVEGAVVEASGEILESKEPRLLHFGVADETAWDVGIACGGNIDVFVEVLDRAWYEFYRKVILSDWSGAVATVVQGSPDHSHSRAAFGGDGEGFGFLEPGIESELQNLLPSLQNSQFVTLESGLKVFVDVFRPAPVLVMIGGVHIAIALTREARNLGIRTVVIDPRRSFGSDYRFPDVDKLVQKWPREAFQDTLPSTNMAVALLTHDPKIDDQALGILLDSDVFYIGALGSRKTHAKRKERLKTMGFTEQKIGRIFAPIGLDIGAEDPEEIALSIMAEIVAVYRGTIKIA